MQFLVRNLGMVREIARQLGPYLMLEILLPGGTVVALLVFLYRRRRSRAGGDVRRGARRDGTTISSHQDTATTFSHSDFKNSTIAC